MPLPHFFTSRASGFLPPIAYLGRRLVTTSTPCLERDENAYLHGNRRRQGLGDGFRAREVDRTAQLPGWHQPARDQPQRAWHQPRGGGAERERDRGDQGP